MKNTEKRIIPETEIKTAENLQKEFKTDKEVLELSPMELKNYFIDLEKSGKLEEFLNAALDNESLVAQFSYWEKWFQKDQRDLLENIIKKKKEIYPGDKDGLPLNLEQKFSEEELKLIFSNLGAIQLSYGCSKGCPFCGFDAVKGVREHIPYGQLANLFENYGKEIGKNKPFLYYASEPSDYDFEDKTYEDVHELAKRFADYSPFVSSKESRNDEWLGFLEKNILEGSTPGFYSTNSRISAYDEDVDEVSKNLAAYKKIDIVGRNSSHIKGIGISAMQESNEKEKQKIGIGCFDGMVLTPRGVYNNIVVEISEKFPQGLILTPFEGFSDSNIKQGEKLNEILSRFVVKNETNNVNRIKNFESGFLNNLVVLDKDNKERFLLINTKLEVIAEVVLKNSAKIDEGEDNLDSFWSEKIKIEKSIGKKVVKEYDDFIKKIHKENFPDSSEKPTVINNGLYKKFGIPTKIIEEVGDKSYVFENNNIKISSRKLKEEKFIKIPESLLQKLEDVKSKIEDLNNSSGFIISREKLKENKSTTMNAITEEFKSQLDGKEVEISVEYFRNKLFLKKNLNGWEVSGNDKYPTNLDFNYPGTRKNERVTLSFCVSKDILFSDQNKITEEETLEVVKRGKKEISINRAKELLGGNVSFKLKIIEVEF